MAFTEELSDKFEPPHVGCYGSDFRYPDCYQN